MFYCFSADEPPGETAPSLPMPGESQANHRRPFNKVPEGCFQCSRDTHQAIHGHLEALTGSLQSNLVSG